MVEAQHRVSTLKLVDTLSEQERLEQLLDASKPPVPPECRHLDYLLATPFRYGSPYPHGSRFRRAGLSPGDGASTVDSLSGPELQRACGFAEATKETLNELVTKFRVTD